MRKAVFKKGFNPFALGLVGGFMMDAAYEGWKNNIVAQDNSDWNICARCMSKLSSYLEGKQKPTGVTKSTVSMDPRVGASAAKKVEDKYKQKHKKRWQFWK
jgi:hypothetical protein